MPEVEDKVSKVEEKMIKNFQCAGCVSGSGLDCGTYKLQRGGPLFGYFGCQSHVPGTSVWGGGSIRTIVIGMPKGFCQVGDVKTGTSDRQFIRLWEKKDLPDDMWNNLNVAVWALVKDGYLFVRTYSPRINLTFVDVIKGGSLELVPKAVDVSKFFDEIDP